MQKDWVSGQAEREGGTTTGQVPYTKTNQQQLEQPLTKRNVSGKWWSPTLCQAKAPAHNR
eukprot:scaffold28470_cov43-Phaeocystis_antarctica.AAC.1